MRLPSLLFFLLVIASSAAAEQANSPSLSSSDPEVRFKAARAIAENPTSSAVPLLVKAITDEPTRYTFPATPVSSLPAILDRDPRPMDTPPFVCGNDGSFIERRLLQKLIVRNQRAMIDALVAIGDPAKTALLEGLDTSTEWELLGAYIKAQGSIKDPRSFPTLSRLVERGDLRAVPILASLGDKNAASSFRKLIRAKGSTEEQIIASVQALEHLQIADATSELLVQFDRRSHSPSSILNLGRALADRKRAELVPRLTTLLNSKNARVRHSAVIVMEKLAHPSHADVLVKQLKDPSIVVQKAVIDALAHSFPVEARKALPMLENDPNPEIRNYITQHLAILQTSAPGV